jgi:hypothetical protein
VSEDEMNERQRELMSHIVEGEPAFEQTAPPPAEAPDLAETMRLLERVSRLPEIRFEKVQRMRELIAADQFETPERIQGTVERLMEELGL